MKHKSDTLNKDQIEWCILLTYFNRVNPNVWLTVDKFNSKIKERNERLHFKKTAYITLSDLEKLEDLGYVELINNLNDVKGTKMYGKYFTVFRLRGE